MLLLQLGQEVATLQLQRGERAGMGIGGNYPLHQSGGRTQREGRVVGGAEERVDLKDIRG